MARQYEGSGLLAVVLTVTVAEGRMEGGKTSVLQRIYNTMSFFELCQKHYQDIHFKEWVI